MPNKIKIGDLLVKAGVLEETHLKAALAEQKRWGGRLGEILVKMNLVSEEVLVKALSRQLGIPAYNIDTLSSVPPQVLAKIPLATARDLRCVPLALRDDNKTLVVVMEEPQNLEAIDILQAITRLKIIGQLAAPSAITRAIYRLYDGGMDVEAASPALPVLTQQGEVRKPTGTFELPSASSVEPLTLLKNVEEAQRRQIATLKALVETLIQKGVFTREEYLSKLKR